jgi:hypothetical protein
MDVDNYIDFHLLQHFSHHGDLRADANWRTAGGGSSAARWRFYVWDTELILHDATSTGPLDRGQDGPGFFNTLATIGEFRIRYADRIQKHLFNGGALTNPRCRERFEKWVPVLDKAVIAESARWGDVRKTPAYTRDQDWLPAVAHVLHTVFAPAGPNRTSAMIAKYRSETWPGTSIPWLLQTQAPSFQINGVAAHGGFLNPADTVSFGITEGIVYYTTDGSDPRVPAGTVPEIEIVGDRAPMAAHIPSDGSLGMSWTAASFNDIGWSHGQGPAGYDRPQGTFDGLIGLDTLAMRGQSASLYLRVPFQLTAQQVADIATLTLQLKYEDGFAAWINGVPVARARVPEVLAWDSPALSARLPESQALVYERFDAGAALSALQPGLNVLAIQVCNNFRGGSDLFCQPRLVFTANDASGVWPTAQRYTVPFTLDAASTLRARALTANGWSPLLEADFILARQPAGGDLIFREIHYHPVNPTPDEVTAAAALSPPEALQDDDFEFLEIVNVSGHPLYLGELSFSDGISFSFPPQVLPAAGIILLTPNPGLFAVRYGPPSARFVYTYAGKLDNAGEQLTLVMKAGDSETVIDTVFWDDAPPWPDSADGDGHSLHRLQPPGSGTNPSSWNAAPPTPGL